MTVAESVQILLAALKAGRSQFSDTLALIERYFEYRPTGFHNGPLYNAPGENAGSCQVFALSRYCNLPEADALQLFAEHYNQVIDNPAGDSHGNIRQYISTGWSGIQFEGEPLTLRPAPHSTEETHS